MFPAYNLKFVKMEFFSQIGSVCPFVIIFFCSDTERNRRDQKTIIKGMDTACGSKQAAQDRRSLTGRCQTARRWELRGGGRLIFLVFNFWILFNSKVKRSLAKVAQRDPKPRRQSLMAATSPPVKSDSAACPPTCPPTRPDPSSIGPCSIIEQDSAGHSCQDPASFDSLPSVQRIGRGGPQGVGDPHKEFGQRQKEPDIHKPEVTMKCSFSLVEPSGLSPLSRRSYILVEQFGTSAFI